MDVPADYNSHICHLMAFLDNEETIDIHQTFTRERLLEVTANDVTRYLVFRMYGKPKPGPNDRPTVWRSSTTKYATKAISHFMQHYGQSWGEAAQRGNPTRSDQVIKLLTQPN